MVVPDLDQALAYFTDAFGAAVLGRTAPKVGSQSGEGVRKQMKADPDAPPQLVMLRLGPNLNVVIYEYDVPGDDLTMPLSGDLGVGHFAFSVDDIGVAGDYLREHGTPSLAGPRTNEGGRVRL